MNTPLRSWSDLLDEAIKLPTARPLIDALVADARALLDLGLVERVHRLDDVGVKGRSWRDQRVNNPKLDPVVREFAALAHSDCGAAGRAGRDLEILACAYRATGEDGFIDRIILQLREMATWSPIQRPGWNYGLPGPDGKGGAWLATGAGVHAIVRTIGLLPEHSLPQELLHALAGLLEKEIAEIVDDWATKRTWFIRTNNAFTNQWIAPTAALVEACLYLGPERFPDAYRLGINNLRKSVTCHAPEGSFEEGFGYASFVRHLFLASHALALAGDRSLFDEPFLQTIGTWYAHHWQPGRFFINCFDANSSAREPLPDDPVLASMRRRGAGLPGDGRAAMLSLMAVCTGNQDALWALHHLAGGPRPSLFGLASLALPAPPREAEPPRFAVYDRARRINWRGSWEENASGVWIRGGHETDQHDHQDRGHVNFIAHGVPLLIEAGCAYYSNPNLPSHYASGAGHNVLQIGLAEVEIGNKEMRRNPPRGWQKYRTVAPLTVYRLDAAGGRVTIDGSTCYDGLNRWLRTVEWTADTMQVHDEVVLPADEPQVVLFRWHLGRRDGVTLATDANGFPVALWNGCELKVTAVGAPACRVRDADREPYPPHPANRMVSANGGTTSVSSAEKGIAVPIRMAAVDMPDHTLRLRDRDDFKMDEDEIHVCLVVRTTGPVNAVTLQTLVHG